MKHFIGPQAFSQFLIGMLITIGCQTAFAVGTASGIDIDNTATVDYKIGGVDQTQISSNQVTFKVDNVVDLTVAATDLTYVSVSPGSTDQILTFTVTNTGNTTQDFILSAAAGTDPFGGTDNFDASSVQVFVESGANAGYQASEDTATFVEELAADDGTGTTFATVYIVSDINIAQANGDIAAYTLTANAADADGDVDGILGAETTATAGADTSTLVDVALGDGIGDTDLANQGDHSATSAYRVTTATLAVNKTSTIVSDPINGTSNPKAIPGAVVEYVVTVSNTGGAATSVLITDQIPDNTTYVAGTATASAGGTVSYSTDGTNFTAGDTTAATHTRATFATVAAGSVPAPTVATLTFRVTID